MRARPSLLLRLRRDTRGATLIEFGFVAPLLCLTVMGIFELGYQMYVSSVVDGALHQAARTATVGSVTGEEIDTQVRDQLAAFSQHGEAVVTTTQRSYSEFSDVRKPEKITGDTEPLLEYNEGDCFEDANGNGEYDLDRGRGGLGQAEDIVDYEVSITYPRMFPMAGLLGWTETATVTHSTVLRNQPFAARSTGVVIVC